MNDNTKLEIAVEVMAAKIAKEIKNGVEPENDIIKELLKERTKMYQGDKETIDKIINVYGIELKNNS